MKKTYNLFLPIATILVLIYSYELNLSASCYSLVTTSSLMNRKSTCTGTSGEGCSGTSFDASYPDDITCSSGTDYASCARKTSQGSFSSIAYSCNPDPTYIAAVNELNEAGKTAIKNRLGDLINGMENNSSENNTATDLMALDAAAIAAAKLLVNANASLPCVKTAIGSPSFGTWQYENDQGSGKCCE
jgi:hypothetical protein